MRKVLLLTVVFFSPVIYKTYGQVVVNPRIQISKDQKLNINCAQADEVEPKRKIKFEFLLLTPSTTDVEVEIVVGPNSSVSQPSIAADQKITIKAIEFPKADESVKILKKEIIVSLSTNMIDKDERVYLLIKDKPAMGVIELNISCDKKKVADATSQKPIDMNVPTVVSSVTTTLPSAAPAVNIVAAATVPPKPAEEKVFCECISIVNGKEILIKPLIKTSGSATETADRSLNFKVSLKHGCRVPGDTIIKIKLITVNESLSEPVLLTEYFPVNRSDWPDGTENKLKILSFTAFVRLKNVDSLGDDKVSYLTLDKCTDGVPNRQVVRESERGIYNSNKPFWVEVGYNFDLLQDIKSGNVFTGVFMYKRDIRSIFKRKRFPNPNLSLFGGFYNSKSISEEVTARFSPLVYFDPNQSLRPIAPPDTFRAFADSGTVKVTSSVRNVGLFISPQVRLTNGSANDDGLHLFASLWIELIWQRFNTSYSYADMKRYDSFNISRSDTYKFNAVSGKPVDGSDDIRSHYWGLGLPIYLKEKTANLYFAPIIGVTNQKLAIKDKIVELLPFRNPFLMPLPVNEDLKTPVLKNIIDVIKKPRWNMFYLVQFRLNEERYGIAFTGEIRGLIKKDYKPVISLAVSKKFDLDKLLTFGLEKSGG